jgi:V8-like Glu-specific endopeptidase
MDTAKQGPGGGVEIVFPPDVRAQINPTTVQPYYWCGQITTVYKNGNTYTGTGTLIDSNWVLTCAHNVWSEEDGGMPASMTFGLAQNGVAFPYGAPVAVTSAGFPDEYKALSPARPNAAGNVVDYTKYLYDFAVLKLASALDPGNGVYPAMFAAADTDLPGRWTCIAGYPGDKIPGTMWNGCYALPNGVDDEILYYVIDTYAGQSGAAVRARFARFQDGVSRIIGIHVAGSVALNRNFAVRLYQERIDRILGWMNGLTKNAVVREL